MTDAAVLAIPEHRSVNPWIVALTVGCAAFMEVLDISIANVALQHIAGNLAASQSESTWVLTSYLAANAIVLPMSSWLSATLGRRRYFLGCIVGFSITSLLCGIAPNLGLLTVFRALQGAVGGGLQPSALAIIADAFPPNKRGQAFAMYGIAVVVAPAIGPTLGGWITDSFSWRWVFLLNVPVGIAVTLLALQVIFDPLDWVAARAARLVNGVRFDVIGFAFLAVGMSTLQVVLDKGQEDDWWGSSFIFWLSMIATASLIGFVVWGLVRKDPLVDLRLLLNRNFAIGNLMMFMLGFILNSSTQLVPQFVQSLMGYTATDAGLVLSWGGVVAFVMMPVVGRTVGLIDTRVLITFGLAATSLGTLYMTRFYLDADYYTFAFARAFQSIGLPFLFIPISAVAYVGVPREKNNDASGLINMMRNLGGSFGISLTNTMIDRMQQVHQNTLVSHVNPYSDLYDNAVQPLQRLFVGQSGDASGSLQQAQGFLYSTLQGQAALLSYIDTFRLLGIVFMALIPLVFLLRKASPSAGAPPAH
ncbi:DHA2 family efflux MFS transporter permease subunit [Methylovirgula sp. 4M-Z18]|uniref:DHA2 family efflux MFS transporter permease subunit n=1 Tax=Methylovirgula sp. 4M-Z18 TaxID=2293567 RepID=UPI000E2EF7E7|nr:DHA2 family efflux MFS transporter permease subunit [Methylovirgula sp. 4M-Z18]RFB78015.1 DHA2 family efflux MFS transporter permease subunit [Methylovirgula sp. 4M-Z18]